LSHPSNPSIFFSLDKGREEERDRRNGQGKRHAGHDVGRFFPEKGKKLIKSMY
jgi:hypothetical protein